MRVDEQVAQILHLGLELFRVDGQDTDEFEEVEEKRLANSEEVVRVIQWPGLRS